VKKEMTEWILPTLLLLVMGGVAGYFAGHLFQKVSGMSLTIGIFAFLLIYLIYIGTFDLKYDAIVTNISQLLEVLGPLGLTTLASSVPFVASFVAGIFLGYRRY
jgi:uncharacterized membrane protein (Fun14 family)